MSAGGMRIHRVTWQGGSDRAEYLDSHLFMSWCRKEDDPNVRLTLSTFRFLEFYLSVDLVVDAFRFARWDFATLLETFNSYPLPPLLPHNQACVRGRVRA
jgi:hypothetical protein